MKLIRIFEFIIPELGLALKFQFNHQVLLSNNLNPTDAIDLDLRVFDHVLVEHIAP